MFMTRLLNSFVEMKTRYRTMLSAFLLLVACWNAPAVDYKAVNDRDAFTRQLNDKTLSVKSIACDFVQEQYLSVFSSKVVSKGKFYYQKSDKIKLDYTSPTKYAMVINGSSLATTSFGKTTVVSLGGNPTMGKMRDLLTACMTGDLSKLDGSFNLACYVSELDYKIVITPKSEAIRTYLLKMEIHLDRNDMSVTGLTMYETENDYTQYRFVNKTFNSVLDEKIFSLH